MTDAQQLWLVWSLEHRGFWCPGRWGYTADIGEAGRFTWAEAKDILARANIVGVQEFLLPAPAEDEPHKKIARRYF